MPTQSRPFCFLISALSAAIFAVRLEIDAEFIELAIVETSVVVRDEIASCKLVADAVASEISAAVAAFTEMSAIRVTPL